MNDDDVAENVTEAAPQDASEPEAQADPKQTAPTETITPGAPGAPEATSPHPAHAIIDEISSNLSVQYKPSWIREKLEQIRALL